MKTVRIMILDHKHTARRETKAFHVDGSPIWTTPSYVLTEDDHRNLGIESNGCAYIHIAMK